MLTSITIQNFRGIGDPVTIPIRPLTIMFGKNSAGKSTVVQALHYAREVLLNRNPNADRTSLGGASIDLGGFRSIVHNHDLSRTIRLRFEFDVDGLPEYENFWEETFRAAQNETVVEPDDDDYDEYNAMKTALQLIKQHRGESFEKSMFGKPEADQYPLESIAAVEFTVAWSNSINSAVITSYTTWLGGEAAGRIETSIDGRDVRRFCNANHKIFLDRTLNELEERESSDPEWDTSLIIQAADPLPTWGRPIGVVPEPASSYDRLRGTQTLTEMIVAPGELLCQLLAEMRYIGPIRETPPRNFQPPNRDEPADWASGLGAWTRLYKDGSLVINVADEMSSSHLKTGYVVALERFREIPLDSELMLALQLGSVMDRIEDTATEVKKYQIKERLVLVDENSGLKLMPNDIGIGISQIVPVVVSAIDSRDMLVAIEQPELHLHPAIQAELGDTFITSAREQENTFLLETHSEHLILRILRRIRETQNEEDTGNSSNVFPEDVSLIYVEPTSDGTQFLSIPITGEGDLETNVPGGFFAERAKELF